MIIYLITIILSLTIIYFAEKFFRHSKVSFWILAFLSLIPSAVIAGIRDFSVGDDISSYVYPNFMVATGMSSLPNFLKYMTHVKEIGNFDYRTGVHQTEVGYSTFIYYISRFSNDPHVLLFLIQLICSIFILFSLYIIKNKYHISLVLGFFIYYTGFYIIGLNLMRQFIAAAILLLAVSFLINENYISYFIFQFLAMLFHISALLGIIIFLIFVLMNSKKNGWKIFNSNNYFLIGLISILFIFVFGNTIFSAFYSIALHIPQLSGHLGSFTTSGGMNRRIAILVSWELLLLYLSSRISKFKDINKNSDLLRIIRIFSVTGVIGIILISLISVQGVVYRMGFMFTFSSIIILPILQTKFSNTKKIGFLMFLVGIFVFSGLIYINYADTVPYTSTILENLGL